MIRKITGIGTSHIRSFIFTKRCFDVRMKINDNSTKQQESKLNSADQKKDILLENKILTDSPAFGNSTTSTFFLGAKELETEIPVSTLPTPTK